MSKVNVIIPTHNHGKYICEAVDSVLNQTYEDYDITIVDDGSSDGTREILSCYGNRINYIYQEQKGPGAAKNTGIENTSGQYVATLDADDLWFPNKLELQMKAFDSDPTLALVYGNVYNFYDSNRETWSLSGFELYRPHAGFVFEQLLLNNFIPSQSVLIRRDCLRATGLFDETLTIGEDWHLWLRIAEKFPVGYISDVVAGRRLHDTNLTNDEILKLESGILILSSFFDRVSKSGSHQNIRNVILSRIGALYARLARECLVKNDRESSRRNALKALSLNPRSSAALKFLAASFLPRRVLAFFTTRRRHLGQNYHKAIASHYHLIDEFLETETGNPWNQLELKHHEE